MIWTRIAKHTITDDEVLRHVKIAIQQDQEDVEEITSVEFTNSGMKWRKFTWGGTSGAVSNKLFNPDTAEAELNNVFNQVMALYAVEKKRGNHWIDISFSNGNLDAVVASGVPFWREWISPFVNETTEGRRLLTLCQGLYESLCATLLNLEPELGAKLLRFVVKHRTSRIVDSATDIPHILFSLYEAEETGYVRALWDEYLQECDSDKTLSEIAHLAQSCGKGDWLDGCIQAWLSSDLNYDLGCLVFQQKRSTESNCKPGLVAMDGLGLWMSPKKLWNAVSVIRGRELGLAGLSQRKIVSNRGQPSDCSYVASTNVSGSGGGTLSSLVNWSPGSRMPTGVI